MAAAQRLPSLHRRAAPANWTGGSDFTGLEQQLHHINTQISSLHQPYENALGALRSDLAEIGRALTDAMPRRAIEALETEVRALADRVDRTRQAGADGAALGSLERELAEVRKALRSLTPAENLGGFEDAVRGAVAKNRSDRRIRPGAPGRPDGVQAARAGRRLVARRGLQRRLGRRLGPACRGSPRARRSIRARHRRQQHRSARQARSADRDADGKRPRRAARAGRFDPRAQRAARPHAAQPGRSACARCARGSHRQAFRKTRRLRFPARPS